MGKRRISETEARRRIQESITDRGLRLRSFALIALAIGLGAWCWDVLQAPSPDLTLFYALVVGAVLCLVVAGWLAVKWSKWWKLLAATAVFLLCFWMIIKYADKVKKEGDQADVYRNLSFGVSAPASGNPFLSMFSVTNRGRVAIGKHTMQCEEVLLVGEANIVGNSAGIVKVSDAPLPSAGGTESDPCLSILRFPSRPICFDVIVEFSYALETQPEIVKTKSTRYLGFERDGIFGWTEQPVGQKISYCADAERQLRELRKSK